MSGEAEADKPLLIQVFRHLLQNLDALVVDFDQIVISGENGNNLVLCLPVDIRQVDLSNVL